MNRRKLLKALAGIPLLGLLVGLPSTEEDLDVTVLQVGLAAMQDATEAAIPGLQALAASSQEVADWGDIWRHDWVTSMARTIDDEIMHS